MRFRVSVVRSGLFRALELRLRVEAVMGFGLGGSEVAVEALQRRVFVKSFCPKPESCK